MSHRFFYLRIQLLWLMEETLVESNKNVTAMLQAKVTFPLFCV